ncbi:AAA family ATPase [Amycolatopsis magusensis]|uniref:DNA-binding SARP family transcriptional activator n=3 Tax=Amycolatopsis magusensis TaxID=882444 RepID=A0ABS4PTH9_9PSEU|nr:AAA family ATPase [Amycolatopsis magusensis]MBP2182742.1 DNA-binding SARP family transcriptional activator [Amycolatopsis magusensis]
MLLSASPNRLTGLLRRDVPLTKLADAAGARLRVVLGPAGAGKSVVLRQLAAEAGLTTRGCGFDGSAVTETGLVRQLARALGRSGPACVDDLLDALDEPADEVLLLLDDAHRLKGTPGAAALARVLAEAPPRLRFVVATRDDRVAGLDGAVLQLDQDDLRWRTWEVERLFGEVYRTPLHPEAAAALCARVEGLPMALRLLHLDTQGLPAAQRAVAFTAPLAHSPRLGQFLSREVLDPLPAELREFALAAAPLGVLDGPLCDTALDRADSGAVLTELSARHALTTRIADGGGAHRFHLLLQQHLEQRLAERLGPHLTRRAYASAATHLADAGHWAEAHRCHARSGDWVAAAAVPRRFGAHAGALIANAAMPVLIGDDPWVALADARRLRADGRLAGAHERYARAGARLPDSRLRWQCAREQSGLANWLDLPAEPLVDDVHGHLAAAVRAHPARLLALSSPISSPEWTLGRAVAALLDGRPGQAVETASALLDGDGFPALAARVLVAVVQGAHRREGTAAQFTRIAADCEAAGWLWLGRVARAGAAVVDPERCADAAAVQATCAEIGDRWGALLAGWFHCVGELHAGHDVVDPLLSLLRRAQDLSARVPETWVRLLLVDELRRRGLPVDDQVRALTAAVAETGLAHAVQRGERLIRERRRPTPPEAELVLVPPVVAEPPPVAVRCFVRFSFSVAGTEIDLDGLRPQPRRVLRMLSVHHGQPLHDERLVTALWPDAPVERAKHRLRVAVSSLRTTLRAHLDPPHGVVRLGNAYVLRLPPDSVVDVDDFAEALHRWRATREPAVGHRVLDLYRGELLAEDGPAEWLLARREALRGEAAGVAVALARAALARGDTTEAEAVCERGVVVDELDHRLWALLAEARTRTGNRAAALRAERAYRDLVAES